MNASVITPVSDAVVVGATSRAANLCGNVLRWTVNSIVFEAPAAGASMVLSEVIEDLRLLQQGRTVYRGRAVVQSVIDNGQIQICEATLEGAWSEMEIAFGLKWPDAKAEFQELIRHCRDSYAVSPEFKAMVVDLHVFMTNLRMWLDKVEMSVLSAPKQEQEHLERLVMEETAHSVAKTIDALIEKFEFLAEQLPDEHRPAHRKLFRQLLHPLILCAPFAHRSFYKPLGYAGDYGMVNMILGDPYQGESLYAKVINAWLLRQAPAEAHRNRLETLLRKLCEETVRVSSEGRPVQIYSLGCGPAAEVCRFLAENDFSDGACFTLVDFSEETLAFARDSLERIQSKHHRRASVEVIKKSVHQILKESKGFDKSNRAPQFDFIYCAGLFDYLTDPVCRRLMGIFYNWLAPGGLLLVTNVDSTLNDSRVFKHSLEYILDWNLIYRTSSRLRALVPDELALGDALVTTEETGVNAFLEIRRPLHG